jgi:hypothetical protein
MLKPKLFSIAKACTGKFGKNEIKPKILDDFEKELKIFHEKLNSSPENETEEHYKNIFRDFLLDALYKGRNYINTKSFSGQFGTDIVIHEKDDVKAG